MILPRFYPILDASSLARANCPVTDAARILLDAGARILQLRVKEHFSRSHFDQAEQIAQWCREAGATFIVNDRADMAVLLEAGCHVGQEDLPAVEARRILGAARMLGLSTHNAAQLEAADREPVDYLAIGPIFATGSKERPDPVVGVEALRELRGLTRKPLVAIGGITRATAPAVLAAGIDCIAVIGDLLPDVRARAAEWVRITTA